ncbi:MAG: 50S ribosomal protein L22 [Puniceicoccales bacterium]|jgi:large subunit ribosomal protein L22|nr:50S ribosomal protein L22 [Puniceicoccales bacterium]
MLLKMYTAEHRHARMSPLKLRQVARILRGQTATVGREKLKFIPRKSARLIGKVLDSAIANAENNFSVPADRLVIDNVIIEEGPAFHRHIPAARGSAHPIRKRTSNIRVNLFSRGQLYGTKS